MQQQTTEMLQQELNAIKVRCFDAETTRDRAVQEAQGYNKILSRIADTLGIMMDVEEHRTFDVADLDRRIAELVELEQNTHHKPEPDPELDVIEEVPPMAERPRNPTKNR